MRNVMLYLMLFAASCGAGFDSPPVGTRVSPPVTLPERTTDEVNDMRQPDDASAGSQSGTRLRRMWISGEDGSKALTRDFWDQQMTMKCHFVQMADNTQRCLPTDLQTPTLYLDAECTRPVFIEPKCGQQTFYVTWAKPDFGGPRGRSCRFAQADIHVNQVQDIPIDSWPQVVYFFGQACDAVRPNLDFTKRVFTIGVEVPLTTFVGANTLVE